MRALCFVSVVGVVLLSGCPQFGVVCNPGTNACGAGCADFTSDRRNCGACGAACLAGQICSNSACVCQAGSQLCNGECTVFETDPRNCGSCNAACAPGQVCEQHTCKAACTLGVSTTCPGGVCADLQSDPQNCGACGHICDDAESCHAGQCSWDLVAACFTSGQIVGVSNADVRGPLQALGTGPISLASYGPVLLAADSIDNRRTPASLPSLRPLSSFIQTGAAPNQVVTDPPYVYVVNSVGHTLQVLGPVDGGCAAAAPVDAGCVFVALDDGGVGEPLMGDGGCFLPAASDGGCADALLDDGGVGPFTFADGGCFVVPVPPPAPFMPCVQGDGGVALVTIGELDFGANTYPQAVAKSGTAVWVPLYGGFGSASAGAGQKVIKVDVTDPHNPTNVGTVDLSTLDLHAFDGGAPVARPYDIRELGGKLYVALNNLNADTYVAEGPGLLAVIDPNNLAGTTTLNLGAGICLDPVCVQPANGRLYVSCAGAAIYDTAHNFALIGTDRAAVVAVDPAAGVTAHWTPSCPADAGLPDGGTSCLPILPSRLAIFGGNVFIGDQNGGRIFVLDSADGGLTEKRGYFGYEAGGPIQACGVDPLLGFLERRRHPVAAVTALLALLLAAGSDSAALHLGPELPPRVSRVVTMAPSLTDTVLRLGGGAALVGVSRYDEAPEVARLPRVGGFNDVSVESVVALKPQLLIVQKSPGNRQAVEKIAELEVPVLALPLTTVGDVLDAIKQIAAVLGVDGKPLVERIELARTHARDVGKQQKKRARVLLIHGFKPLVVAGPDSFSGELLDDVGAVNLAEKAPSAYPVYSVERAVALQPDVIIDCSDVDDGRAELKALLKHSRWVQLQSHALLQPGPALADGIAELQRAVYP